MKQSRSVFDAWRAAERDARLMHVRWASTLANSNGSPADLVSVDHLAARLGIQRRLAHEEFQRALENISAMARALRCTRDGAIGGGDATDPSSSAVRQWPDRRGEG